MAMHFKKLGKDGPKLGCGSVWRHVYEPAWTDKKEEVTCRRCLKLMLKALYEKMNPK